jgi:hypothetical protein
VLAPGDVVDAVGRAWDPDLTSAAVPALRSTRAALRARAPTRGACRTAERIHPTSSRRVHRATGDMGVRSSHRRALRQRGVRAEELAT